MSFVFVYLSLISILLFNMLIVGIYVEINGIPIYCVFNISDMEYLFKWFS